MTRGTDERRGASAAARVLAPLALVAAVIVVVVIVAGSLDGSSEADGDERPASQGSAAIDCEPSEPQAVRDGYYVVQPGEPGLSAVSDKTCVPMRRLQRLNERLDPQLIPQGAYVNLRRDGCKALAES